MGNVGIKGNANANVEPKIIEEEKTNYDGT
jgi:hypothetical protein